MDAEIVETGLVRAQPQALEWKGAAKRALAAREERQEIISKVLVEGQDFGVIPGTSKPTLLKPGAEKIADALNLYPTFKSLTIETDRESGFYLYRYECELRSRGTDSLVATGIGSCNCFESKYRWRKSERKCPDCQADNIRKSKNSPEWYCWQKTGGCGATFPLNAEAILIQEVGRVENPDLHDTVNTVDKMAQKRAFIAAVLFLGLSDRFTQDMEDLPHQDATPKAESQPSEKAAPRKSKSKPKPKPETSAPKAMKPARDNPENPFAAENHYKGKKVHEIGPKDGRVRVYEATIDDLHTHAQKAEARGFDSWVRFVDDELDRREKYRRIEENASAGEAQNAKANGGSGSLLDQAADQLENGRPLEPDIRPENDEFELSPP